MRILAEVLDGLPFVAREGDPRTIGPSAEVWPEERRAVERAVAKRQNEYFATRHLARLALTELEVPHAPILNNDDRSPRWPDGVFGSLTHTDTWCGVAVARREGLVSGLGIDMERLGSVSPAVAQRILSERELGDGSGVDAAVRFSAKEALYKAIYPFVRRYVGFAEVEIELRSETKFDVCIVSEVLRAELAPLKLSGVYTTKGDLCCTALVVE